MPENESVQYNFLEYNGATIGYNPALEGKITQQMLDNAIARLESTSNSEISGRSAMRPLQSVEVLAVASQNVSPYLENMGYDGWEYIDPNSTQTFLDHGGDWMMVVTQTIGFSSRYAKINGNDAYREDYDIFGDVYLDYWDISGTQGGTFSVIAQGPGAPQNLVDSIYIL